MIRLVIGILALLFAGRAYAATDLTAQRLSFGNTLCVSGTGLDVCYPVYAPPAGNYTPAFGGSASARATDDFSILDCGPNNTGSVTYTLPRSHATSFTGSITGTTLTVPTNTLVVANDTITGAGVANGTYVVSGSGTTWTVNISQTVGSTTLTASAFPTGHGLAVKNSATNFTCVVTVASGSSIYGAAGVVNGNPASVGGQIAIFPGGEASFEADANNNYVVSGFVAGSWYQTANGTSVSTITWTNIQGYPEYDLHCDGLIPARSGDSVGLQFAYGGTFQTTGYNWLRSRFNQGSTITIVDFPGSGGAGDTTAISVTGGNNNGGPANTDGAATMLHMTSAASTGAGFRYSVLGISSYFSSSSASEGQSSISGAGPYSSSNGLLTGVQLVNQLANNTGSNFVSGMCWLRPSL